MWQFDGRLSGSNVRYYSSQTMQWETENRCTYPMFPLSIWYGMDNNDGESPFKCKHEWRKYNQNIPPQKYSNCGRRRKDDEWWKGFRNKDRWFHNCVLLCLSTGCNHFGRSLTSFTLTSPSLNAARKVWAVFVCLFVRACLCVFVFTGWNLNDTDTL